MRALPGRDTRSDATERATLTRQSASRDQRERILRAVGELVAKRGYNDVTVALIVKRARVSYRTFYKQFDGKEECFLALFDAEMERSRERIEAALAASSTEPWPAQVIAALRAIFDSILVDPLIARATIVEGPTVGPAIAERYERLATALAPLLARGREFAPDAAQLPASLEDTLAGGVFWSAYQRLIVGAAADLGGLLPEIVAFVLRPYLGEDEAARWARAAQDGAGVASAS